MTLTLIIGFILIILEILYDISRHNRNLNDKPQSTLIWLLLIIMLSLWLPGMYHSNVLLFIGQRFMFFDFGYNIARWKSLPIARNSRISKWMSEDIRSQLPKISLKELNIEIDRYYKMYLGTYIELLSRKERFFYRIELITTKMFYHGTEEKLSEMKWWKYDKIMSKMIWQFELLLKVVVFLTVILDYYMDGSIIDWIFSFI